jgi:pilus assembly protein CpaE
VISAIDNSTFVCMVGMLDTLSLKNTRLGLETLELMGYDEDRIVLVLNRADSRVGIDDEDVVAVIGRRPDVRVPSDVQVPRAVNEGSPIVASRPDSAAAVAFTGLANEFLRRSGEAPVFKDPGGGGRGLRELADVFRSRDGKTESPADEAPAEQSRRRLTARRR